MKPFWERQFRCRRERHHETRLEWSSEGISASNRTTWAHWRIRLGAAWLLLSRSGINLIRGRYLFVPSFGSEFRSRCFEALGSHLPKPTRNRAPSGTSKSSPARLLASPSIKKWKDSKRNNKNKSFFINLRCRFVFQELRRPCPRFVAWKFCPGQFVVSYKTLPSPWSPFALHEQLSIWVKVLLNKRDTFGSQMSRNLTRLRGLIVDKSFFMDSPSERPSKSMNKSSALTVNSSVSLMHFVGISSGTFFFQIHFNPN